MATKYPQLDWNFANKFIDKIISDTDEMYTFYESLNESMLTNPADYDKLRAMHSRVHEQICEYYNYLEKVNVPASKSYITHWLMDDRIGDMFEDVTTFLGT
jgi:hypothetical protein